MNKKIRTVGICALLVIWVALTGFLWFGAKSDYTYSERRPLAQMPNAHSTANEALQNHADNLSIRYT